MIESLWVIVMYISNKGTDAGQDRMSGRCSRLPSAHLCVHAHIEVVGLKPFETNHHQHISFSSKISVCIIYF